MENVKLEPFSDRLHARSKEIWKGTIHIPLSRQLEMVRFLKTNLPIT